MSGDFISIAVCALCTISALVFSITQYELYDTMPEVWKLGCISCIATIVCSLVRIYDVKPHEKGLIYFTNICIFFSGTLFLSVQITLCISQPVAWFTGMVSGIVFAVCLWVRFHKRE